MLDDKYVSVVALICTCMCVYVCVYNVKIVITARYELTKHIIVVM